jgi:hypothetical protein
MRSDRIDQRSLLTDEEMARASRGANSLLEMTCFARAYAFLANVELCVGAERQRDHALTTLRLKPTTYVVDSGSDRRFMTFLVEPDSGWADVRSTHEGIPHDPSDQHGSMKRGGRQP